MVAYGRTMVTLSNKEIWAFVDAFENSEDRDVRTLGKGFRDLIYRHAGVVNWKLKLFPGECTLMMEHAPTPELKAKMQGFIKKA